MPISLCQASRTKGHWFKGLAIVGKAEEEESKSVLFARWNEHQRILSAVLLVCSRLGLTALTFASLPITV